MKLGTAIAEILKREGIEILCGYRSISDRACRQRRYPSVIVRQERIGLHMADRDFAGHLGPQYRCLLHAAWTRRRERDGPAWAQCYGESVPVLGAADGLCAPDFEHRAQLHSSQA